LLSSSSSNPGTVAKHTSNLEKPSLKHSCPNETQEACIQQPQSTNRLHAYQCCLVCGFGPAGTGRFRASVPRRRNAAGCIIGLGMERDWCLFVCPLFLLAWRTHLAELLPAAFNGPFVESCCPALPFSTAKSVHRNPSHPGPDLACATDRDLIFFFFFHLHFAQFRFSRSRVFPGPSLGRKPQRRSGQLGPWPIQPTTPGHGNLRLKVGNLVIVRSVNRRPRKSTTTNLEAHVRQGLGFDKNTE
jgi:hypothetical protein